MFNNLIMQVTGNTLIAFEKWYKSLTYHYPKLNTCIETKTVGFYHLPDDMKIGVFISFFDSVGIEIAIGKKLFTIKTEILDFGDGRKTRTEANTAAVEKADELFNSRA